MGGNCALSIISPIINKLNPKQFKMTILGDSGVGKTTLFLKMIRDEDYPNAVPTQNHNVEQFKFQKLNFKIWDVPSRGNIPELWHLYYENYSQAIIYVLDVTKQSQQWRQKNQKSQLERVLNNKYVKESNLPILFFANRIDTQPEISQLTDIEIFQKCGIDMSLLQNVQWRIERICSFDRSAILKGFNWLTENLLQKQKAPK